MHSANKGYLEAGIELEKVLDCVLRDRTMATLETHQNGPLRLTDDGTILIAHSRVSLDTVVHHYKLGASAEQIVHKFPGLELANVHGAIAYYLNHRAAVEQYLGEQEAKGDEVQKRIESDPQYQKKSDELRLRLLSRKVR